MKTLNFGKHEGEKLTDCEPSYIKWLATHKMVLAERNWWSSDLARELLGEKEMGYQVGQVVKILNATGTVIATVTRVIEDKIFATLQEGGTYEYAGTNLAPATDQDIVKAKAWAEREAEMRNPKPLSHMDVPADFGMFDEDGVRIA